MLSENSALTDVLIDGPTLQLAMDGDRVQARVTSGAHAPRRSGVITKILERARHSIVGSFVRIDGTFCAVPSNGGRPILLKHLPHPAPKENDLIVARIVMWPTLDRPAMGEIAEVLGSREEQGVELQALVRKYELPSAFPADVEAAAGAFGEEVSQDAWQGRQTFFDSRVFTIDGADAKDFDDAVSVDRLPNGLWRLGVHIADVAHYVKEHSALDKEAYRRGTSVYLTGTVLPMLPFPLSDGLCSLRPDCVRLTLTCLMDINAQGEVVHYEVFESAIRSAQRFTYGQVELILKGESIPGVSVDIESDVREMGQLAALVRRVRMARGSLDFDFPEPDILIGPDGRPTDIRRRERQESHRLIEDFMLLANETVAKHMSRGPFLYRIHETPDQAKMEKLRDTLEAVGVKVPRGFTEARPKVLQQVIRECEGKPIQALVQMMMLRSLKQAIYSPTNAGHFGLASPCYTHFTSPIRRYPDLIVHRLIKERLAGQFDAARQAHYKAQLPKLAAHCSRRERVAVDAEREYLDVQRVYFMRQHVGSTFTGVISSVTAFGFFVQLDDYFVEGLVHVSNLKGDYYIFDEVRLTLRGRRSGQAFHIGQTVQVQLAAANIEKHQLDFELVGAPGVKSRT